MNFKSLAGLAVIGAMASATPAMAQDTDEGNFYIGVQGGYHDLGVENEEIDDLLDGTDFRFDDSGLIYGLVAGIEFNIGNGPLSLGLEGTANLGDGPIDGDYGGLAFVGYDLNETTQIEVRGGWHSVRIDPFAVIGATEREDPELDRELAQLDVTADDYLVGLGARYKLSNGFAIRGAVDTVSFDSVRGTIGLLATFR